MEYGLEIQKTYVKRVIDNYERAKGNIEHEFTFITTSLLAILSALFPETGHEIIHFDEVSELPYGESFIKSTDYFKLIRDALAHKTNENFSDISSIENEIVRIRLKARNRDCIELSMRDMEKIIKKIKKELNL